LKPITINIITGYSGSGKSTALNAFEDAGYYCVDNMPVALLPKFLELAAERESEVTSVALVMDLREEGFLSRYETIFSAIRSQGHAIKLIFLEAEEKTLVQRYSQTRRQHPLSDGKGLTAGIHAEKVQLQPLRIAADRIIDTTYFNVHKLKSTIINIAAKSKSVSPISILIQSFGFKYGIPHDADLLIDVRFLANPYFVPELKPLTGEASSIRQFVLNDPNCHLFLEKYFDLIDYLVPLYEKEGKAYLTIAVGCTGGKHRSVTIAGCIHKHFEPSEYQVALSHRDIDQ